MHGVKGGTTRIYKYGCGQPVELLPQAELQLELETGYWNALTDIELRYRQGERAAWGSVQPVEEIARDLDTTLAELAAVRAEIEEARRGRQGVRLEWRQRAEALERRRQDLQKNLYAARSAHWKDVRVHVEALGAWRREAARGAYAEFSARGLYWGNSMLVRDRYEVARRRAEQSLTRGGRPAQLHPRTHDGTGFWAVRLEHVAKDRDRPFTMRRIFDADSKWSRMLQIDPIDFTDWEHMSRGERRRRSRTQMRIRVASRGREPIWMELPLVMHRPLPDGAAVKAAEVLRRRVGTHFVYALLLTVHVGAAADERALQAPTLAVALGCEPHTDGLRVAVCLGSQGSLEEFVLPNRLLERFQTLDRLASERAKAYRAAAQEFDAWHVAHGDIAPGWLAAACRERSSHAPEALRALTDYWRCHRFQGDETAFARLEEWRRRDKRRLEWEANLREKCLGFRMDLYRKFAHRVAGSYGRVVIHKPVLHRRRERPMPETRDGVLRMSTRRLMQVAALFTLQTALEQAFAKVGGTRCVTPRGLELWRHFACNASDGTTGLEVVRCPDCNQLFDPELNSCQHLVQWAAAHD